MNRRDLIKGIGAVICAGSIPTFLPQLIPQAPYGGRYYLYLGGHRFQGSLNGDFKVEVPGSEISKIPAGNYESRVMVEMSPEAPMRQAIFDVEVV